MGTADELGDAVTCGPGVEDRDRSKDVVAGAADELSDVAVGAADNVGAAADDVGADDVIASALLVGVSAGAIDTADATVDVVLVVVVMNAACEVEATVVGGGNHLCGTPHSAAESSMISLSSESSSWGRFNCCTNVSIHVRK